MGAKWVRAWTGGRVRLDRRGREIFVIERRGYTIRLDAGNEKQAEVELSRFEDDPDSYKTKSQRKLEREHAAAEAVAKAVRVDERTISSFMAFLRGAKLDDEGEPLLQKDKNGAVVLDAQRQPLELADTNNHPRSRVYRITCHCYLTQWAEFYAGRDVRSVGLQELKKQLARWGYAEKARITALKSLMAFLREVRCLIERRDDPTLDLKTPVAIAEKNKRARLGERKFYEMMHVAKLYRAIDTWDSATRPVLGGTVQAVRDLIRLCAFHGIHVSEVGRIAEGGDQARVRAVDGRGEISGTVEFLHKSGKRHILSLNPHTLAAARRLQDRGAIPSASYVRKVIAKAAKASSVKAIDPGTLRHSFITWAKNHGRIVRAESGGVPLQEISAIVGHESTATTSRFYDGTEIPPMIALPLRLEHPLDPLPFDSHSKRADRGAAKLSAR